MIRESFRGRRLGPSRDLRTRRKLAKTTLFASEFEVMSAEIATGNFCQMDQRRKFMGIGMRELVVILLVVLLLFGAKKLRTIGSDLGAAVKGFKKSMNDGEDEELHPPKQIRSDEKDAEFAEASKTSAKSDKNA